VAMNGEYLPMLGVSSVSLPPVSSRFTLYMTPQHPRRRQFLLEGVDPAWREAACEMSISARFFNEKGERVSQDTDPLLGETPGWNGSLENPVFDRRHTTIIAPPNAHSFWLVISSAGPPETLGTLLIKGITITRTHGNGRPEVVMRAPVGNDTRFSPVQPAPWGFTADGLRPNMAKLLTLNTQNGPEECFAIIDDDVEGHAEWRTVKESAPELAGGDRLDIDWEVAYSVGGGLVWVQEYERPPAGTYKLRVRPVDLQGRPDGEETTLSIRVLAPWWRQGWVWTLLAAGTTLCAFALSRYIAHQRIREELTRMKEETLRKAEVELVRMARATTLGEFTASIAHEISQPLAGICTNANACLRWLAPERSNIDEARAAVQRISRDGDRAAQIIARIRAMLAKEKPIRESTCINAVVEELLPLLRSDIQRRGVTLAYVPGNDLPAVSIDRVQIQQVITNLIVNALDAMSEVTDRPRELRISTGCDSRTVFVKVEDSGIGLDPETIGRLFDRFFTTKAEGLGIGLAICRSIAESHGGSLVAKPNTGPGATFQFTLPIKR